MSPGSKAVLFALAVAVARETASAPTLVHAGLECIAPGRFAVVLSGIDPSAEIQTAKVYFRSQLYPDFYWVAMTYEEGRFVAILPQATPETPRVIYYLEAIDQAFEVARSAEFDPIVDDCDDDPAVAYLSGSAPEIVVGATTAGASAIPPGFAAAGIIGTIASTGVASSLGAGIGTGVAVAGAAGAAGAAAAVVVVAQGDSSSTTTVAAAAPTSSVAPPTSTTTAPRSSTTTVPGSSTSTTSVTPATTTSSTPGSTTSSLPTTSTTSTPGSTTSSTTTSSSTSSSTTTTTPPVTTTTTAGSPLNASCFTVQVKGPCQVTVDASCVAKPVDRYDWVLDTQDEFDRVDIPDGDEEEDHKWDDDDCEEDENITFRLTVYRGAISSTAEKTVRVRGEDDIRAPEQVELSIETRLELAAPDRWSRGRFSIDGRLIAAVTGGQPLTARAALSPGVHELEAVVVRTPGQPGSWSFDFRGTKVASLQVLQGNALTTEGGVALQLGGEPEERFRLRFTLER
jgi:hypothetical protein